MNFQLMLEEILLEGKIDDIKDSYPNISTDIKDKYHEMSGDNGNHLRWLLDLHKKGGDNTPIHSQHNVQELLSTLSNKAISSKLERKNIGQYKSVDDLHSTISPFIGTNLSVKDKAKKGTEMIYASPTMTIRRHNNQESCIKAGILPDNNKTKQDKAAWCISADSDDARALHDHYTHENAIPIYSIEHHHEDGSSSRHMLVADPFKTESTVELRDEHDYKPGFNNKTDTNDTILTDYKKKYPEINKTPLSGFFNDSPEKKQDDFIEKETSRKNMSAGLGNLYHSVNDKHQEKIFNRAIEHNNLPLLSNLSTNLNSITQDTNKLDKLADVGSVHNHTELLSNVYNNYITSPETRRKIIEHSFKHKNLDLMSNIASNVSGSDNLNKMIDLGIAHNHTKLLKAVYANTSTGQPKIHKHALDSKNYALLEHMPYGLSKEHISGLINHFEKHGVESAYSLDKLAGYNDISHKDLDRINDIKINHYIGNNDASSLGYVNSFKPEHIDKMVKSGIKNNNGLDDVAIKNKPELLTDDHKTDLINHTLKQITPTPNFNEKNYNLVNKLRGIVSSGLNDTHRELLGDYVAKNKEFDLLNKLHPDNVLGTEQNKKILSLHDANLSRHIANVDNSDDLIQHAVKIKNLDYLNHPRVAKKINDKDLDTVFSHAVENNKIDNVSGIIAHSNHPDIVDKLVTHMYSHPKNIEALKSSLVDLTDDMKSKIRATTTSPEVKDVLDNKLHESFERLLRKSLIS